MKVQITQDISQFINLNVPAFKYQHNEFSSKKEFPMMIKFNKTYYKYIDEKLTAFRILAYTINDKYNNSNDLYYLVQFPNQAPQWINNFITYESKIYASADDYILSGGTNYIQHNWVPMFQCLNLVNKIKNYSNWYFFNQDFYTIKNGAVCVSLKGAYCAYLLVTENGCLAYIPKDSCQNHWGEQNIYLNKSDAMKVLLNGMEIVDFAEEPISFNINILPNEPKYTKLKFVE